MSDSSDVQREDVTATQGEVDRLTALHFDPAHIEAEAWSDVLQEEYEAGERRRRSPSRVAFRTPADQPDLTATGRPVVGVCTTHDQGCCAGCPTLGCRFCHCRRDKEACTHV